MSWKKGVGLGEHSIYVAVEEGLPILHYDHLKNRNRFLICLADPWIPVPTIAEWFWRWQLKGGAQVTAEYTMQQASRHVVLIQVTRWEPNNHRRPSGLKEGLEEKPKPTQQLSLGAWGVWGRAPTRLDLVSKSHLSMDWLSPQKRSDFTIFTLGMEAFSPSGSALELRCPSWGTTWTFQTDFYAFNPWTFNGISLWRLLGT
jgi:hypothetical protein